MLLDLWEKFSLGNDVIADQAHKENISMADMTGKAAMLHHMYKAQHPAS